MTFTFTFADVTAHHVSTLVSIKNNKNSSSSSGRGSFSSGDTNPTMSTAANSSASRSMSSAMVQAPLGNWSAAMIPTCWYPRESNVLRNVCTMQCHHDVSKWCIQMQWSNSSSRKVILHLMQSNTLSVASHWMSRCITTRIHNKINFSQVCGSAALC